MARNRKDTPMQGPVRVAMRVSFKGSYPELPPGSVVSGKGSINEKSTGSWFRPVLDPDHVQVITACGVCALLGEPEDEVRRTFLVPDGVPTKDLRFHLYLASPPGDTWVVSREA